MYINGLGNIANILNVAVTFSLLLVPVVIGVCVVGVCGIYWYLSYMKLEIQSCMLTNIYRDKGIQTCIKQKNTYTHTDIQGCSQLFKI